MGALLVGGYFAALLVLGFIARRRAVQTPEEYYVAGRSFGAVLLFLTLAATNFSAFTFLGFAGAAYTHGFGQYGVMAAGTSLMAVMFYLVGRRVWRIGKDLGCLTPPELIGRRLKSHPLRLLVLAVMVVYTIPYLAIQAVGAGLLLNSVVGWEVAFGAAVTLAVIAAYVLAGGMRGSGWTDALQGFAMMAALFLAVVFVADGLGGFTAAGEKAFDAEPMLFSRPGPEGYFTPQIWLSFMLLWVFVDPMFPQLFSRFYTAKSEASLRGAMVLYPFLISVLFLAPVLIGVWASGTDLAVGNADLVLPEMVKAYAPEWVYLFVMVGALAALMSTADSQLLSLSTMLAHDLGFRGSKVRVSQVMTVALTVFALAFIVFGFDPDAGIFGTLVATTFSGLVVLFPTAWAALYHPTTNPHACIASIVCGQASIVLVRYGVLPTFGFLEGIIALAVAGVVLVVGTTVFPRKGRGSTSAAFGT